MPTRPQVYLKILEKINKILKKKWNKILNKLCIMGQNFGWWGVVVVGGALNPFLLCTILQNFRKYAPNLPRPPRIRPK